MMKKESDLDVKSKRFHCLKGLTLYSFTHRTSLFRDEDLQKAIRLSEQEAQDKERKQREKLERENQEKLFGSNNQSSRYNESLKDG